MKEADENDTDDSCASTSNGADTGGADRISDISKGATDFSRASVDLRTGVFAGETSDAPPVSSQACAEIGKACSTSSLGSSAEVALAHSIQARQRQAEGNCFSRGMVGTEQGLPTSVRLPASEPPNSLTAEVMFAPLVAPSDAKYCDRERGSDCPDKQVALPKDHHATAERIPVSEPPDSLAFGLTACEGSSEDDRIIDRKIFTRAEDLPEEDSVPIKIPASEPQLSALADPDACARSSDENRGFELKSQTKGGRSLKEESIAIVPASEPPEVVLSGSLVCKDPFRADFSIELESPPKHASTMEERLATMVTTMESTKDDSPVPEKYAQNPSRDFSAAPLPPPVPQVRPGAYAVAGPGHARATQATWDDSSMATMQTTREDTFATEAAVDAVVVDSQRPLAQDTGSLPPLVVAQVPKSCTIYDRRVQTAVLVLLLVIAFVFGIIFGVVLPEREKNDGPSKSSGMPTTSPAPTLSFQASAAPTSLAWVEAGSIDGAFAGNSTIFSFSRDGYRLAASFAPPTLPTRREVPMGSVRVYEGRDGSWNQLGNSINANATSVSLAGDRVAVGVSGVTFGVSVFELVNDVWTMVGNRISSEGWTVILSRDGDILAVEATDTVQVYQWDKTMGWLPRGNAIPTTPRKMDFGSAYSRAAMSNDGAVLAIELSVYTYDNDQDKWEGVNLRIESDPPNFPVSVSGDGLVVAIAQPQSNINGRNSGRVRLFRLHGAEWKQYGDDIIGDGQVNGLWGWSHSLSEDGSRIAIINNPVRDKNIAIVFRLQGPRWVRLVDEVPLAMENGAISISDEGNRVAVGGGGIIRCFAIVGRTH